MNKLSNPVGWFEIYVQDMLRAKKFYESVFQVQLERLNCPTDVDIELWSFPMNMEQNGATGALVKMKDGPESGGNSVMIYFSCTDCAVEAERAVSSGGQIVKQKMSIGQYGFMALVIDTEGNCIGLHSMQ